MTRGETATSETGYVKRLVEQGFGEEFEGFWIRPIRGGTEWITEVVNGVEVASPGKCREENRMRRRIRFGRDSRSVQRYDPCYVPYKRLTRS